MEIELTEEALFQLAVDHFGIEHQTVVAIEEFTEVSKELTKVLRGEGNKNHLAEELADAEIVIAQMKQFYDVSNAVECWKKTKLKRLFRRIVGAER